MKNQVLTSLIACSFVALLGTVPAAAQQRQTATIPFAFEAGGVEYPEGNYLVERMNFVLAITNLTNRHTALVAAPILSGKNNDGQAKLVFNRTADRLQLAEVWFNGHPGMITARAKEVSAKVVVNFK